MNRIKKFNELNEGLFNKTNYDKLILKIIDHFKNNPEELNNIEWDFDTAEFEYQGYNFLVVFKDYLYKVNNSPIEQNKKIKKYSVQIILDRNKLIDGYKYIESKYNIKLLNLLNNYKNQEYSNRKQSEMDDISNMLNKADYDELILDIIDHFKNNEEELNNVEWDKGFSSYKDASFEYQGYKFMVDFIDYDFTKNPIEKQKKVKEHSVVIILGTDYKYIKSKHNIKLLNLLSNYKKQKYIKRKQSEMDDISGMFDL